MANLWQMIDTYLQEEIHEEMGLDGMYGYMGVAQVIIDDMLTLEKAIIADVFPLILLRSLTSKEAISEHGTLATTGRLTVDHEYPYDLLMMVKVDGKAECRAAAQELRQRLITFFAKRRALGGLAAPDGERVRLVTLSNTEIYLYGRSDVEDATFYGIAETFVTIQTRG